MRRTLRRLFRDLLLTTLLGMAVTWCVAFIAAHVIASSHPMASSLVFTDRLELSARSSLTWLGILVPATALIAAGVSWFRSARRGEPRRLAPALLLGALLALILAGLQSSLVPAAHRARRELLHDGLPAGLDVILRQRREIRDDRHTLTWREVDRDDEGATRILGVTLEDRRRDGPSPVARARHAVPRFTADRRRLHLTLIEVVHSEVLASERLEVVIDLGSLLREESGAGVEELTHAALLKSGRDGRSELVRRLAAVLATLLLALSGAWAGFAAGARRPPEREDA